MIKFNCPVCSKLYRADNGLLGRKTRCKQCGHVMVISVNLPGFRTKKGPGDVKGTAAPWAWLSAAAQPEAGDNLDAAPPVPPPVAPRAQDLPSAPGFAGTPSPRRDLWGEPAEGLAIPADPVDSLTPLSGPEVIPRVALLGGRYQLERLLGEGGMGQVYYGRDTVLGRPVAVKLIRPRSPGLRNRSLHDGHLRQAFQEEARIGAELTHPAIATVFDFGFYEGEPFTVFEFIEGETLATTLGRRGRLPLEDARLILGALAQALDFAHSRHIVHRDLKPENIRATAQGHYKILDLGLARQFRESADWRFAGTPEYASPEQAAGLPCDGRTDQYALAVIAYEMLTGQRPFEAPHGDRMGVLKMHRDAPPAPPRALVPDLPATINGALLRALDKDPNRRFSSCQEFALALGCRLLVEEVQAPEILRLTPAWLGFSSGGGHLALTADALWFAGEAELIGWRLCELAGVRRPGGLWKLLACLKIEIRGASGLERHRLFLHSKKWRQEWQGVLARHARGEAAPSPSAPPPAVRPAVLIDRDPGIRYQSLGAVEYEDSKRGTARAGLRVQATLMGADAVIHIEEERLPELTRSVRRARGTAVRAVDSSGQRELLGRWFTETMGRFSLALFGILALFLMGSVALQYLAMGVPAEQPSLGQTILFPVLGLSWPLALAVSLRWLRWPQLVRATSLTFLGLAVLASPPFLLLAWLLAVAITGQWWPSMSIRYLYDPFAWLIPLVLAYAALRAWRMHRDYRRLVGPWSGPEPVGRRLTGVGTLVVSALFCLSLLVLKVVGTVEQARAAVRPGSPEWHARNAVALIQKGTPEGMERALRDAIESWDKVPDDYELAPDLRIVQGGTCFDLAEIHLQRGQEDQAKRLFRRALVALDKAEELSARKPHLRLARSQMRNLLLIRASARNDLGVVLRRQGDLDDARLQFRQAAADCADLLRDHPGDDAVVRLKELAEENLGR
jgi:tetratricopeptide (TPR) repeat protein/tRNA A-37 threonylcarbamoyl transferase component Bud32